eukprot:12437481-Prorocentrum_lima.AAC.1
MNDTSPKQGVLGVKTKEFVFVLQVDSRFTLHVWAVLSTAKTPTVVMLTADRSSICGACRGT